ncbi:Maf family nucleotide pyrophosphatase [uncultured Roseovarius sp.]|uniref:Maf family nucleotide pyrophosphatase n=1 Tax=uncultured Roseovarius sp. TaxID=293344 RepID=UPI000C5D9F9B|nr:septum formation protein Maf [Roseovarius sp.]|tara:strand:+ start:1174 stop:1773 length:600 start_codon:yes stop_codon:yes gene_type:complete
MNTPLILASSSAIRQSLLRNAGLAFETATPRVDEESVRAALLAEGAKPRDIADALAELKATKISARHPAALVIGCDQVLDLGGTLLSKPETVDEARAQLSAMRGKRHDLLSAVVICQAGRPLWRHIGTARMTVRPFSDDWLDGYLSRNWPDIAESVGAYKLEAEGVRLFSRVDGDYFTVLGLPLLDLLSFLTLRGDLQQ